MGSQVQDAETKDFRECIVNCNLTELQTVGRSFTWTSGHVYSRIDRALANDEWVMNMPTVQVLLMDPQCSDHSPLSIEVEVPKDSQKRPFKYYNCIAQHPEFHNKVLQRWTIQGKGMKGVWNNLKQVRREMTKINQQEYRGVSDKVQQLRRDLDSKQSQMRNIPVPQDMEESEKQIREELNKWSSIEETIYKQKSRYNGSS